MDQSLVVGSGLEILKRLPEQVTPERLSTAFVILGLVFFFGLLIWGIVEIFKLTVK